ncbi:MAG: N-acetyl-gamma-glutamyl-phosphate reductase [Oscillospiraceae bacterium]|jgi:N-acetyl-gamma-glutamyl-phosphate reductase|nr:N-acetyl-gamma-glutamyl-phosphate reductase [Oscillospiraceae bacterium]
MKKTTVYIDGEAGTTGLKIRSRLESVEGIELLAIEEKLRKDVGERKKMLNTADFVFLCLPDEAAKEAVSLIENGEVRVIDASTAHRTHPGWVYGFPELSVNQEEMIRLSRRVAVPGCYATGFIALVRPLVKAGIIPSDYPVSAYAVSGYSGGGRAAIAEYESGVRPAELSGARLYALSQEHKHLPEMQKICGLEHPPMFNPMIDDFYSGMVVCVPLQARTLPKEYSVSDILRTYKSHYPEIGRVRVIEDYGGAFLASNALSGSDDIELFAFGNGEKILLVARLDNLGKGACGAAVQCFEIMRKNQEKQHGYI